MVRKQKKETQLDIIVEKVIKEEFVSASFIQRKLQISYLSAMKVLKQLEEFGYVEKGADFTKRRVVRHSYIQ